MDVREVRAALNELRPMVQGDGGDLELLGAEGGVVRLRLLLQGAECAECVLPADLLEQVALDALCRSVAGVTAVQVDDPRRAAT
jgi:Fe-S cluster biogenesis protein NfuA